MTIRPPSAAAAAAALLFLLLATFAPALGSTTPSSSYAFVAAPPPILAIPPTHRRSSRRPSPTALNESPPSPSPRRSNQRTNDNLAYEIYNRNTNRRRDLGWIEMHTLLERYVETHRRRRNTRNNGGAAAGDDDAGGGAAAVVDVPFNYRCRLGRTSGGGGRKRTTTGSRRVGGGRGGGNDDDDIHRDDDDDRVNLGKWLRKQRRSHRTGALSAWKVRMLSDALGGGTDWNGGAAAAADGITPSWAVRGVDAYYTLTVGSESKGACADYARWKRSMAVDDAAGAASASGAASGAAVAGSGGSGSSVFNNDSSSDIGSWEGQQQQRKEEEEGRAAARSLERWLEMQSWSLDGGTAQDEGRRRQEEEEDGPEKRRIPLRQPRTSGASAGRRRQMIKSRVRWDIVREGWYPEIITNIM